MPFRVRIKVTIPSELLAYERVRNSLAKKLRTKTGPDLARLFDGTVEGWKNKPDWKQKLTNNAVTLSEAVWADGPYAAQYRLVARGSPPHRIPKFGTTFMRFRPGYRASTRPGSLMSRRSYKYGAFVTRFVVNHPGFDSRDFDVLIAAKEEPIFIDDMQDAVNEAVRSQPHSSKTY